MKRPSEAVLPGSALCSEKVCKKAPNAFSHSAPFYTVSVVLYSGPRLAAWGFRTGTSWQIEAKSAGIENACTVSRITPSTVRTSVGLQDWRKDCEAWGGYIMSEDVSTQSRRLYVGESGPLPYLLSLPPGTDFQSYPMIVFLHGHDEGVPTRIDKALTRHGPLYEGCPRWVGEHFIVIAPQLPERGDLWYLQSDAVLEISHQVQEIYQGDASRRYLTGFSFGGNGVFDLALEQSWAWTALWAVDPTRVPDTDPGTPIWLSSGAVSRRRKRAYEVRLGLSAPGELPEDRVYEDRGLDHVATAADAYADENVYKWLLSRQPMSG